jgi:hypothetical protein
VAEWLRSGLQSRVHRFDSGRRLVWVCGRKLLTLERLFGSEGDVPHRHGDLVQRRLAQVELGGGEVRVAHRRLGDLEAGVAGDVVAVGVSERVGGDVGRYPGTLRTFFTSRQIACSEAGERR